MLIKIAIFLLCAVLFRLGGWDRARWSGWRDVLIPLILGAYVSVHYIWWAGLLTAGAFQIIRLGRGVPDETDDGSLLARFIYNDLNIHKPWAVRGAWGLIVAIVGGGPGFGVAQAYLVYCVYCVLNAVIDALVEALKLPAWTVEIAEGAAVGAMVFLI